jgi:signal transduction histidine kinase
VKVYAHEVDGILRHRDAANETNDVGDVSGHGRSGALLSYVTIIWSVVAACALLLAIMYGLVWAMDRQARASLAFACEALAIVGLVVMELGMMRASSAESWGEWVRWNQVPIFLRVAGTVFFIRAYFGTGRAWLMWFIIAGRGVILLLGFAVDPNFNFERIDSISHINFLGEPVTVLGHGVRASWQWFATLTSLLIPLFVIDASIPLWRKGTREARRKVLVIGGATIVTSLLGTTYSQLMILWGVPLPALLSPPYLIMLAVMTAEMSRDTLRASRLARELRDSESRLHLAASAAGLGLWTWDARLNRIWATAPAYRMLGLPEDRPADVASVVSRIHVQDLERVDRVWRQGAQSGDEVDVQFRVTHPSGTTRWIAARGRAEVDARGDLGSIQGVLRDVTEQLATREEIEELRRELAHAGRVSVLGTLSSSLAHELGQPLGAILLNTEAAELLLQHPQPDLDEIRHILADIRRDDSRAAEVIDRLRKLLKRGQMDTAPLSIEALAQDVVTLLRSDAINRHVILEFFGENGVPFIRGDRVHLSQVLINLVMNGMDAVAQLPPAQRHVVLRAHADGRGFVEVSVADCGPGIEAALLAKIFDPFFTTKSNGMGMGLSVSRTIVEAHGGKLWAENRPQGGAVFLMTLPVAT